EHTMFDMRFGESVKKATNDGGYLGINVEPAGRAIILLKTQDDRLSTEISAEYYLPYGVAKHVKKEELKVRYHAPFINIYLSPEKREINIQSDLPGENKEYLLSDFRQIAELLIFLHQTKKEKIC